MLNDCVKLVVPVINEIFGKNYANDAKIILYHNEYFIHYGKGKQQKRVTDSFFTIDNDKYVFECQSTTDNSMIIRIFEYSIQAALETANFVANDTLEISIPNTAILYLRSTLNTPDKMKIVIRTPEGETQFHAPIMKMKNYTLDSIFEKKLFFLLPFFAFNHESEFFEYEKNPTKLEKFKQEYLEIFNRLEQALMNNEIVTLDVGTIMDMAHKVIKKLTVKHNIIREGVDSIMGGKILEYTSKTMFNAGKKEGREEGRQEGLKEGKQEGINEDRQRVATEMIRENLPLDMIARVSKLSNDIILGLAASLGIKLA